MIQPITNFRSMDVGCHEQIVCPRYIAVGGKCLYIHDGCCLIEELDKPLRTMCE